MSMRTRRLGKTELNLTTVGLGTWAIGGPWQFGWGPQQDDESIGAIVEALEDGINWIDTAPVYGCGHSEEVVGLALKQTSQKVYLATKCGLLWDEKREKVNCLKKNSVLKECDDSLRRLGVDVIDLYQMHWPEPEADMEEGWEAMNLLKEQGKVRYVGVSNCSIEQMKRMQRIAAIDSLQPPYSMMHRGIEDKIIRFCRENNIGIVVYSPMQRGLLTGKFDHEKLKQLAPDDHRHRSADFQEPRFSAALELVDRLKPLTQRKECSLAQLSIAWTLRWPEVTSAIVGARRSDQIAETSRAMNVELSELDIREIESYLNDFESKVS